MSSTETPSRYVIGIDLGTTNCAVAYVDTHEAEPRPRVLPVLQWETEEAVTEADMLPSFYYLAVKAEWKRGQLKLPFQTLADGVEPPDFAVGRLARLKASQVPGRVIHSAKSWLCHGGVGREDRILPWHSDEVIGDDRRSPIEVSAAYLAHLREVWNHEIASDDETKRFELQTVTITVPASFDEAAQRLTLDAAAKAGYVRERVRLLEEPQAAFYYWLALEKERAAELRGKTVLICDIGGGTSDFSLFSVAADDAPGKAKAGATLPEIHRVAVSDHLLLGGDNIDLSLAHVLERKMVGAGRRLSSRQWAQLVFEARQLKEKALAEMGQRAASTGGEPVEDSSELFVSIAGEGASLFATTMTAGLTPAAIEQHIVEGFVPPCARDEGPRRQRAGLTQLGLPYAQDTAISRHLAGFLAGRDVDAVLFTGGTLKPQFIRDQVVAQLTAWQGRAPLALTNDAMDLAVALGAAHYGAVLRRPEGRIKGGYARSVYVEVAQAGGTHALVCIVPKGFDAATPLRIDSLGLKAVTARPVRFQLFTSNRRGEDQPGQIIALDADHFHPLPPLHTRLDLAGARKGDERLIDVALEVSLQETGVLQLFCVPKEPDAETTRWQLDFNLRAAATPLEPPEGEEPVPALTSQSLPPAKLQLVKDKLDLLYGKKRRPEAEGENPKYLIRDLESALGRTRDEWDTPFLRSLWPLLEQGLTRRNRSLGHELSWLYLAGFALRPGYGYELDEWRVAELWRSYEIGLSFPKERQIEEQWWIMWRRVAGGLSREQQEAVFDKIFPAIRKGEVASPEIYMLAGSLERIEMGDKVRLGTQLVQQIAAGRKQHLDQRMWALARIASRVPLYGGPESIVRPKFVGDWIRELDGLDLSRPPYNRLNLFLSQAGRIVQDREFDLPEELRKRVQKKLEASGAAEDLTRVVREFVPVDTAARAQLFGESLPAGLVLG